MARAQGATMCKSTPDPHEIEVRAKALVDQLVESLDSRSHTLGYSWQNLTPGERWSFRDAWREIIVEALK